MEKLLENVMLYAVTTINVTFYFMNKPTTTDVQHTKIAQTNVKHQVELIVMQRHLCCEHYQVAQEQHMQLRLDLLRVLLRLMTG
jgi:hypothetical protein